MIKRATLRFSQKAGLGVLLFALLSLGLGLIPTRHPEDYVAKKAAVEMDEALKEQIQEVKEGLDGDSQAEANALELSLKDAKSLEERMEAYQNLLSFWSLRNPAIGALFAKERALETDSLPHFVEAGQRFISVISVMDEKDQAWAAEEAMGMFDAALEMDSRNVEARRGKASALVQGGQQPMQGIQILRELLDENPEDIETVLELAHFSVISSQFSKAQERYHQVLMLDSTRTEAYFHLGETWIKLGKRDSAQIYYQRYRETLPEGEARARFDVYLADVLSIAEKH